MELSDINPHIRYARSHKNILILNENSICYDCRIFFIKKGVNCIIVDQKKYDFPNNTLFYFPPRTKYRILPKTNEDISILVFNFDLINKFSHIKDSIGTALESNFDSKKSPCYSLPSEFSTTIVQKDSKLYETLITCSNEFLRKNLHYRETASALLKYCLIQLLNEATPTSEIQLANKVIEFIQENFQNPTITNTIISKHFNYHPYYLSSVMKDATGYTLHQYLLDYRIKMAKNYLITTDYDISVISWKSGFNSCAYFIKVFKDFTNITPKKYRDTNKHLSIL